MKSNFSILSGGVLLLLTCSSFASSFQGKIEGFELSSCHSTKCFRLVSPVAYVSGIDGNYAFDKATFSVQNRSLASDDVYYDKRLKKIFFRNVSGEDYIYDVTTGSLNQYGK